MAISYVISSLKQAHLIRKLLWVVALCFALAFATQFTTQGTAQATGNEVRSQGNPDAPVVLIEYASLTCPHCGRFHKETVKKVLSDYIENGQLLYIYRDFPLDGSALGASMLAECVGRNGNNKNYFKFLDVLYDKQNQWRRAADIRGALIQLASFTGLNASQAELCLQDTAVYDGVIADREQGEKDGVNATPSVFINGKRQNDTSSRGIKKRIDDLLS